MTTHTNTPPTEQIDYAAAIQQAAAALQVLVGRASKAGYRVELSLRNLPSAEYTYIGARVVKKRTEAK